MSGPALYTPAARGKFRAGLAASRRGMSKGSARLETYAGIKNMLYSCREQDNGYT